MCINILLRGVNEYSEAYSETHLRWSIFVCPVNDFKPLTV